MDLRRSPRATGLTAAVRAFIDQHIAPLKHAFHRQVAQRPAIDGNPGQLLSGGQA